MRETYITFRNTPGVAVVGRKQRTAFVLEDGDLLEITPAPDMWVSGTYHYDEEHKEHYWKSDDEHFVGLIDGMKVRVIDMEEQH